MTKKQIKGLLRISNQLLFYLKRLQTQEHIRNKDVVNEITLNIQGEIDRLIEWEK